MDKEFLGKLKATLEIVDKRLQVLEHLVNDVIIGGLESAANEYADEEKYAAFSDSYGPMVVEIQKHMDDCGQDMDCLRELYDNLKEADGYGTEGFDEKATVEAKIAELKKLFGVEAVKEAVEKVEEPASEDEDSDEDLARIFNETKN